MVRNFFSLSGDVTKAGDWVVEYYQRYYVQFMLAPEYGIFHPRFNKMEQPYYNQIPT